MGPGSDRRTHRGLGRDLLRSLGVVFLSEVRELALAWLVFICHFSQRTSSFASPSCVLGGYITLYHTGSKKPVLFFSYVDLLFRT